MSWERLHSLHAHTLNACIVHAAYLGAVVVASAVDSGTRDGTVGEDNLGGNSTQTKAGRDDELADLLLKGHVSLHGQAAAAHIHASGAEGGSKGLGKVKSEGEVVEKVR